MSDEAVIDVSAVIERQKRGRFLVALVALSWTITFFDGFDMNVISYAMPYMAAEFQLDKIMTGYVFSAGLVGTLVGGFLFGYAGDRFGRRPAIIVSTAMFGATTLCLALAASYHALLAVRVLIGIGAGGMLPLAWALNLEYSAKRYRATIVTLVMVGYSLGTFVGGPVSIWLIPRFGWQSVFVVGGVLSLLAAGALVLMLPESIRYLASKGRRPDLIAATLRQVAPELAIPAGARFVAADEEGQAKDFKPSLLFGGDLLVITPPLWLAYIFSSMTAFFLATWTPLVLEALAFARNEAAAVGSITAVAGMLGGLILMRFTDRLGAIAIVAMPLIAIPALLAAGLGDVDHPSFTALIALIAMALIGGHFGLHSIAGIFYPSAWRANGAGWATSVAKIGSIAGPWLGGVILATGLPVRHIFVILAVCPAMVLICTLLIGIAQRRMWRREAARVPDAPHTANGPHGAAGGGANLLPMARELSP